MARLSRYRVHILVLLLDIPREGRRIRLDFELSCATGHIFVFTRDLATYGVYLNLLFLLLERNVAASQARIRGESAIGVPLHHGRGFRWRLMILHQLPLLLVLVR